MLASLSSERDSFIGAVGVLPDVAGLELAFVVKELLSVEVRGFMLGRADAAACFSLNVFGV